MNNREYWRERMRALEEKGYRESEAYYEELKKKFTSANNQIQMDIDRWYHRLAENNNISYASAAKFLNKSELEEFQWSVWEYIRKGKENALNQEWMKELENASANVHISYLQSMKIQLQQHAEELYTQYEKGMTQLLTNRYTNGFYDYSGEFKTFESGFKSAADAIGYVLDYYMNNGECMSDWTPTTTLLKYTNSSGFFSDFKIDNSVKEVSFD